MSLEIYTDGSAHPNPGPGGFGVVVVNQGTVIDLYDKQFKGPVTNNEMELKAILWAFLNYGVKIDGNQSQRIPVVYSDSAYCVNTLNDWCFGWARNGWVKSDKKTPENLKLIKVYHEWYEKGYRIHLKKIKGHAGHEFNELADQMATGQKHAEDLLYKQYLT
jgi:ribonuclease HI